MTDSPIIDTHSHWQSRAHVEALRDAVRATPSAHERMLAERLDPDEMMLNLDIRLAEMDAAGVQVSVLSLPPPGLTFGDPRVRAQLARIINDDLINAAQQHTGRFAVLVSLPLPSVPEALDELERVGSHSVVRGVQVHTITDEGWTLDDQRFEPVYRRVAELGLVVLVHPAREHRSAAWADWRLPSTLASMTSSSLSAARLVLSGMLDRVRTLDVIVPHLGGVLPYLAQRFADFGAGLASHDLPWYLRERLFFDTCSYHPPAFRCAVSTCGVDRLVMGTDYPFRGSLQRAVDDIKNTLADPNEQQAVLGRTAGRWFTLDPRVDCQVFKPLRTHKGDG